MARYEWRGLIWRQRSGDDWSPEARLLLAYLLSGPATNRIGCFAVSFDEAAQHTGIAQARVREIFSAFDEARLVRFDPACGWIWVPEVLHQHPFADTEEVRRALPELAAVPREAAFRGELVHQFRESADRPGAQPQPDGKRLTGIIGDDRASDLAQRLAGANEKLRKHLPGLPLFQPTRLERPARGFIRIADYLKRWRGFFADLVNAPSLRILGLLTIIGAIVFVVFPGIDLGVAGWFFDPPRNFTLGASWIGRFFDTEIHYAMEWFLVVLVGVFLYGLVRGKSYWGLTPKKFLYVALSIGLGAGLVTNVVFKDSWGRARPSQIAEFGGPKHFSPPFMRSDQCDKNCSFVSGDASLAACFTAFAMIAERNRRRWWVGLGGFAALVGLMRMARGSHFLSDVVFGIIFSLMVVFFLARLILEDRWRAWPRWRQSQ